MVERRYHRYAYFVTLTYAPEFYPDDECLHKDHLIKYFKRLCRSVPDKLVNVGVGEYGDESGRAHFHCCVYSDVPIFRNIIDSWSIDNVPIGRVDVSQLSNGRCKYCAGYVVKKMDKMDDERLDGRTPEFKILPRRPALGFGLIYEIADMCARYPRFRAQFENRTFVPHAIKIGGDWIRLPRYVRDHLKGFFDDPDHKRKQQDYVRKKSRKEAVVARALTQSMSCVRGLDKRWKQLKSDFADVFKGLNDRNELAYNKRKRRVL